MLIATHDGSFHADETLACAILTYLYENSNIIRSRDLDVLEKADIIIDVSGKNDHKHFDHHSNDFKDCRSNGIRFATAGIMWYKFGLEFLKKLDSKGIPFALSNVIEHKDQENSLLKKWVEDNYFNVNFIKSNYSNSNYHIKNKKAETKEVLITNY